MNFSDFIIHELGPINKPLRFFGNIFIRPFCAPSFHKFWQDWNPAYRYVLWSFVYRPVRSFLPQRVAAFVTFLASGFFLHDLPLGVGIKWIHGNFVTPIVTLLFAVFGALMLLSKALKIDLSGRPTILRAAANTAWLLSSVALLAVILKFAK
jgi:hypothetical protein